MSQKIIYRFITEELFEHETDNLQLPGMTRNFIYEEFYPNHKMNIEESALKFINHWFEQSFTEYSWELNNEYVLSDGATIDKEKLKKNLILFSSPSLHFPIVFIL